LQSVVQSVVDQGRQVTKLCVYGDHLRLATTSTGRNLPYQKPVDLL
jgi:hypothetical protein